MLGIIDVGGGMRDVFGAGVMDYCLDHGISFDYCLGVSAGASNLIGYLAEQKGRSKTFYTNYAFRDDYMGVKHYKETGDFINLHYSLQIQLSVHIKSASGGDSLFRLLYWEDC